MNFCPQCGAKLSTDARFCHRCGRALAGQGRKVTLAWLLAGGAVVLLVGVLAFQALRREAAPRPAAPFAQGAASGGAPPDLSTMSPREAADRLFERVMRAQESGDTATAVRFTPMARQAYGMIGALDVDARLHVALIELAAGNAPPALAQADSVAARSPGHLFAPIIRARAYELLGQGDDARSAYRAFLDAEAAERAAQHAEYVEHATLLDRFHAEAVSAMAGR